MKTLNQFFFLVALLLSAWTIAGCTKEAESGPTTVAGQVLLRGTRQPVTRAPAVQVWGRASGGNAVSGSTRAYAPVGPAQPTDAQGQFSFSFEAEAGWDYVLQLVPGGLGYYVGITQAPALRGGRKNEGIAFFVDPPCWVRVDLVDELPHNQVEIFFSGFGGGGYKIRPSRDTSLVFPYLTGGGRETFIYWSITPYNVPNGSPWSVTSDSRTFIQPPLDTQRVRIAF